LTWQIYLTIGAQHGAAISEEKSFPEKSLGKKEQREEKNRGRENYQARRQKIWPSDNHGQAQCQNS
jgi:hypothetical protein